MVSFEQMQEIRFGEETIPVMLQRSRRRSLTISITNDATLHIKAPYLMPEFMIRSFLHQKKEWILDKITDRKMRSQSSFGRWDHGEHVHFFDKLMLIMVTETEQTERPRVYAINTTFQVLLPVGTPPEKRGRWIKEALFDWYKSHVKTPLQERVERYAQHMGLAFETLRVKDVSSHWGSCSVNRNLNFNFRVGMLPIELCDYVIVHELCHLREMNHSQRFWNLVGEYLPNYKELRTRLKKEYINLN